MVNLMELFEEYRIKSGLSMNQLANLIDGMTVGYYSKLVNGFRHSLGIVLAVEVAKTLNIPGDKFLKSIGYDLDT